MDSSRRAVEAYWRSKEIELATSDEDKVAPVYKLEEICELLRSSHVSIVKEVSEYILKRLNHKSPIVKQKTLRLIKYCVGKSGVEFRREMQRNSSAVRQLFHYKGQVDPLKGDALNKAVRDTSHEAISAIFASEDDTKTSPAEDLNRRIEGFGNTNYAMPSEDKKSFLSEVVDLGSASLKYGLSSIAADHSLRKTDSGSGSYKGPILRRSLTTEIDAPDRYERFDRSSETRSGSGISKNVAGGSWGQESRVNAVEMTNGESSSSHAVNKSREERLLETIVTSGGVRLQPSRDALQVFIVEASKLDAVVLSLALESKLQSHLWQVRMKAVCVLEALLRKKDDTHFAIVASYFTENKDTVVKCSDSPQASLREKATKVLNILEGEGSAENPCSTKPVKPAVVEMPDLIDTGDSDYYGTDQPTNQVTSNPPTIDDLFGDTSLTPTNNGHKPEEGDPFADVSFHSPDNKSPPSDDLFSGLTIDDPKPKQQVLDIFGSTFEATTQPPPPTTTHKDNVHDIMAGFSNYQKPLEANNGMLGMQYNQILPQNVMFNQPMPINYGAMGSFLAQQQLLAATMSNFQPHGNNTTEGALPDIFNPSIPVQNSSTMMNNTKKEDTKAFDFISEHLSAVRDPKRVV